MKVEYLEEKVEVDFNDEGSYPNHIPPTWKYLA